MEYYYTNPENIKETSLKIIDDQAKHLNKVLRKKTGNEIYVTDGLGNLYKCLIKEIIKKEILCSIVEKKFNVNEPAIKLTVYISLLKNPSRFEFAIEKLTELGVYEINPIITERVISKKKDKTGRWQSIALSAMKQSQRCRLPKVPGPIDFKDAVKNCKDDIKLIAHLTPSTSLRLRVVVDQPPLHIERGSKSIGSVALFIGPEGGFTDEEASLAESTGFNIISLGLRKYRSETAAITAAALILINIEN